MGKDEGKGPELEVRSQERKSPNVASGSANLLESISERTHLPEGKEAVRRILREVYRHRRIGTKDLAYVTRLPVPVVAAVRRELEKSGLLSRKGGAILTEEGEDYVTRILGISTVEVLVCASCLGRKISINHPYETILRKVEEYSRLRPRPYTWLDQAFATPQTAVLRALYMLEEGDVEGRNILFLGDDDLTSVATGLLKTAKKIAVIDIDDRLLDLIEDVSRREKLEIECIHHDLRNSLPTGLGNTYDIVFTDPPYTTQGLKLFVSRGIQALRPRKCASMYLSFAHKPPEDMLDVQIAINEMGLVIKEIIPRFNRYEGAEMFANTTFLARLETTDGTRPSITGRFEGKMYTGEISPTVRTYKCRCGKEFEVGTSKSFRTVELLKSNGCPACGRKKGFILIRKEKLKDR
jgi:predicted methyltransferase